jgi:hypothetical protein
MWTEENIKGVNLNMKLFNSKKSELKRKTELHFTFLHFPKKCDFPGAFFLILCALYIFIVFTWFLYFWPRDTSFYFFPGFYIFHVQKCDFRVAFLYTFLYIFKNCNKFARRIFNMLLFFWKLWFASRIF